MKFTKKHPSEELRLLALSNLRFLNSPREKEFDDITLLASQACGTPVAALSFVGEDKLWYKAAYGFEVTETQRDSSFCSHTILQKNLFEVPDTHKKESFKEYAYVAEKGFRFYAGVPVLSPDGWPVGSLCVFDVVPKTLSGGQAAALQVLSAQITNLFKFRILTATHEKLTLRARYERTLIENLSEGIVLVDKNGKMIECNKAATEIMGLESESNLVGKKISDSGWKTITEDGQKFPESELPTNKCFSTGEKQTNVVLGIYRAPDDLRWISINATPLYLEPGNKPSHVVTSFRDITEVRALDSNRRYLEAKLGDSSRLSALGEMAGGIAHEINNPLAIILGKTHLLKQKLEAGILDQTHLNDFEKIELTVERIAKIIRSLKLYSRHSETDPLVATDLSEVISSTLELCSARFISQGVELKVTCEPGLNIECRAAQISQLLMSLLNNSFEAVQNLQNRWVSISVQELSEHYEISVTDSGPGIPHHLINKIMQPFFSTKEFGKGMGLGLSVALGIAEGHKGKFEYDRQSKNTKFVLTLPKFQEQNRKVS